MTVDMASVGWIPVQNKKLDLDQPFGQRSSSTEELEQDWCWKMQVVGSYSVRQIAALFPSQFGRSISKSTADNYIGAARERHSVHTEHIIKNGVNDALEQLRWAQNKQWTKVEYYETQMDLLRKHRDELMNGGYEKLLEEKVRESAEGDQVSITIPIDLISNAKKDLMAAEKLHDAALDAFVKSAERFLKWTGLIAPTKFQIDGDISVTHQLDPAQAQTMQRSLQAVEKMKAIAASRQDLSAFGEDIVDAEEVLDPAS